MNISVVRHMLNVDSVSDPAATDAEMTVQLQFSKFSHSEAILSSLRV